MNATAETFVSEFTVNLAVNTGVDAFDGDGFHFGSDFGRAAKSAAISAAMSGASEYAREKHRQKSMSQETTTLPYETDGQVTPIGNNSSGGLSPVKVNADMNAKPGLNVPMNSPRTPTPQTQRSLNMMNRLKNFKPPPSSLENNRFQR